MVTRMPLAQRRAQLVQKALEIATAEGIGAVTVRRVAEEAGVALGVVHYCFEDKDELLSSLAERIVNDLTEASAEQVVDLSAHDLPSALRGALTGIWSSITATRDAQLLTYEITTHALRQPALRGVADSQYQVSQSAGELLMALCADIGRATWTIPAEEVAASALAYLDGVTLRWLVDDDSDAALARLERFCDYLAGFAEPLGPDAPSIAAPSIAAPSIAAPSIAAPSVAAPSVAEPGND